MKWNVKILSMILVSIIVFFSVFIYFNGGSFCNLPHTGGCPRLYGFEAIFESFRFLLIMLIFFLPPIVSGNIFIIFYLYVIKNKKFRTKNDINYKLVYKQHKTNILLMIGCLFLTSAYLLVGLWSGLTWAGNLLFLIMLVIMVHMVVYLTLLVIKGYKATSKK